MTEYVHLVGAEQVQNAARQMSSAATEMMRAASYMDEILRQHRNTMDDWLARFAAARDDGTRRGVVVRSPSQT